MWSLAINPCVALVFAVIAMPAFGEQPAKERRDLAHQLNKLESHAIQRKGKTPRTSDLLIEQDLRVSGQRLNTLKTKTPQSMNNRLLERQFDRVQRQNRLFNR